MAGMRQWRFHVRPTGKGFMQVSLNTKLAGNLKMSALPPDQECQSLATFIDSAKQVLLGRDDGDDHLE